MLLRRFFEYHCAFRNRPNVSQEQEENAMFYFIVALVCAIAGAMPLWIGRKVKAALIQTAVSVPVLWGPVYFSTPSTVWPLFGAFGLFVFLLWFIAALIDGIMEDNITFAAAFPCIAMVLYIGSFILGSGMFRASDYARMVGTIEERVWTQDVQPKDPRHMRMSSHENAIYLARKVLGEAGAIGSQFSISGDHMTLQKIGEELWYVVPLDYAGFSVYTSTRGVPGYVMVDGEDPHRQPVLVMFPEQRMQYTPGAYFEYNLERHMRTHGYFNIGLADYTFEIDDENKPWWVVTTFQPTIMWSGEKLTGVAVVNPFTGDIKFEELGKIESWIDRVIPKDYVKMYLAWYGKYNNGWFNSWWGRLNLTEPENPILIYGSEGQPDFVTGITSNNASDDSLIGLVYTSSHDGKSVFYKTNGGSTDAAVLDAVNKNQKVQFRHLHGVDPQLYNVYGTMASVVPLLSGNHAFQGVAIVEINNIQTVAVGDNQFDALREYEKLLSEQGQRIALEKFHDLSAIEGVVDRIGCENSSTGTLCYVHIVNVPHLFTGSSDMSPKLLVTRASDKIRVEFVASGEDVVPMRSFDNLSLVLQKTTVQQEMQKRREDNKAGDEAKQNAPTIRERLKQLTPKELEELGKHLPSQK